MTSLTADITVSVYGAYVGSGDVSNPSQTINYSNRMQVTPGTSSGQADLYFEDTRTVSASSSENLDLAGVLTDRFGNTLTFVKVKAIVVYAESANTNSVNVGGAASNGFTAPFADSTDIISVKPGGVFVWTNPTGSTVTASTGDILKVANSSSGTSVTYTIQIIGTSA